VCKAVTLASPVSLSFFPDVFSLCPTTRPPYQASSRGQKTRTVASIGTTWPFLTFSTVTSARVGLRSFGSFGAVCFFSFGTLGTLSAFFSFFSFLSLMGSQDSLAPRLCGLYRSSTRSFFKSSSSCVNKETRRPSHQLPVRVKIKR
jgi:hypothetical protein